LEAVVADPDQCLAKLPVLTEAERGQLLVDWNRTEITYPKDRCLHDLFEEQVARRPEAVAVVFEGAQLTYRQLNERANQLMNHLRKRSVRSGDLVGILLERSLEMVVGLLGILKAGGAYVPLDPNHPPERLAFMIKDARLRVVVTLNSFCEKLSTSEGQFICFDSDREEIERQSRANPHGAVTTDNLAYVIYTSGSTGKPKGVAVPHRAVLRLVLNTDYVDLGPDDRIAQASNPSFDAATFEIWGALLNGARLVGVALETLLAPAEFANFLRREHITTLFLTTAFFNQMAREVPDGFLGLRHLLFGGEQVDARWVQNVLRAGAPRRLVHVYGPTENTTFSTWHLVGDLAKSSAEIPIGRPIANSTAYVLDRNRQLLPLGVAGELFVGGDGLACGYLGQPELTAECFVPNPFDGGRTRLYRTGDIVRRLADGQLLFIGRIDHQVKIRGFRVELEEIEVSLRHHSSVGQCVVIARDDDTGDKQLIAYIVPLYQHGAAPHIEELREFLKQKLPEYMVPAAFVTLEKLPLTSNGKIDRIALPAPEPGRASFDAGYVAPRTPTEEALAQIWCRVLGLTRLGVHDNFFDLGGHSLRAVQLLVEVNRSFDRKLPLTTIYDAPTVAALASELNSKTVPQFSPMVGLRSGKTFPPLFIMSAGGNSMELAVARYISEDRQIYGLQAMGIDGISHPHKRVEDIAEYYMRHVQQLQPNGPYLLAGFSFGGLVALEVAHRFLRNGKDVALLALLDTTPHPRFLPLGFLIAYWKRRAYEHAAAVAQLPLRKAGPYLFKRLCAVREFIRARYFDGYRWRQSPSDPALPGAVRAVVEGALSAQRLYRPRYYPGTITLLKAEKTVGFWQGYAAFWAKMAAKLDVYTVPGDHMEMITTHAESVGAQLSLCIEGALRSEHHSCSAVGSATRASSREQAPA
jgi:amino acid adenylation domain-containing protein